MAALQTVPGSGNPLVLQTRLTSRLGSLAAVPFWLAVLVLVWYLGGLESDWGGVIALFGLYQLVQSLYRLAATTTVTVDGNGQTITRKTQLLGQTLRGQRIEGRQLDRLFVSQTAVAVRAQQSRPSEWQLLALPKSGSALVVNSGGTEAEMNALAAQVGALLRVRPADQAPESKPALSVFNSPRTQPRQDVSAYARPKREGVASSPAPLREPAALARQPAPTSGPIPLANPWDSPLGSPGAGALFPASMGALFAAPMNPLDATGFSAPMPLNPTASPSLFPVSSGGEFSSPFASLSELPAATLIADEPVVERPVQNLRGYTVAQLEEMARADPSDGRIWAALGRRYADARQWPLATQALQESVKYDPLNAETMNDLGLVYLRSGKVVEAQKTFQHAVGLDPFSIQARLNLAFVLRRLGRNREADAILADAEQYAWDPMQQQQVQAARSGSNPQLDRSFFQSSRNPT